MLLVAGTLTVDRLFRCAQLPEREGTCRGATSLHIGGLAGIEALAALRSGVKVMLAASVGDDDDAKLVRSLLQRHGVPATLSVCPNAPTGSSATFLDDSGRYLRVDANAANALFEAGAEVEQLLDGTRMLLCQCDGNPRAIHRLFTMARDRHIRTVLHACPPRPEVLRVLLPMSDLVIVDTDGFSEIMRVTDAQGWGDFSGSQLHALSDARLDALCRGVVGSDIVLMMGARGAFVSEGSGDYRLIGGGMQSGGLDFCCAEETFVGALCARLYDGDGLFQAVQFALCASSMPGPTGGQDSIPRWADVLALMERGLEEEN